MIQTRKKYTKITYGRNHYFTVLCESFCISVNNPKFLSVTLLHEMCAVSVFNVPES